MGRVYINGSAGYCSPPNPIEVDFDPVRGTVFRIKYHCAGDNLAGLATLLFNENIRFHWNRGTIKSTLEAEISGGTLGWSDAPQANWQILGNEVQESVLQSPKALQLQRIAPPVDTEGETFVGAIQALQQAASAIAQNDQATAETLRDLIPEEGQSLWDELIDLLTRGTTHYYRGQYVLKRTLTISNFYTGSLPNDGSVESIVSTADILTLGMPPVYQTKISSIPVTADIDDKYTWGWRQLPSTMTTTACNRTEHSTEWWLGFWRNSLYPGT